MAAIPVSVVNADQEPELPMQDLGPQFTQAISELLSPMSIKRLTVVDDDVDATQLRASLDAVKGNVSNLHDVLLEMSSRIDNPQLVDVQGVLLPDSDLRDAIEEGWNVWPTTDKVALRAASPGAEHENLTALTTVAALLPAGIEYLPLSVAEWKAKKDELVGSVHPATLIFFDRDLTKAKLGKSGGDKLIRELYKRDLEAVYSGVFTHEAKNAFDEMQISEQLTKTIKKPVPAMSKARVAEASEFIAGLQVFLHIQNLHALKDHLRTALKTALADTQTSIDEVGFYAIMASAASANDEGVLENDGLLRIARAKFRRATQTHLRSDVPVDAISSIRKATVSAISSVLPKSGEADRLMWEERFDSGEYLANTKLPTEIGDIYKLTNRAGEEAFYILLAQPCDLMVRSDGKRANAPNSFVLANVIERDAPEKSERLISLGAAFEGSDRPWAVNLAKRTYLPPQLLDACVLSTNGKATIKPGTKSDPTLPAGWQKVPHKLNAWRKSRVDQGKSLIDLLPPIEDFPERDDVAKALYEGAFGSAVSEGTVSLKVEASGAIEAGVQRVQRLVEAHAKAVLIQFSHYQARPDMPNDLMRDQPPSHGGETGL